MISKEILAKSLAEQAKSDMPLGVILANNGNLRNIDLYQVIAEQKDLKFIDLLTFDLSKINLINNDDYERYIDEGYLPLFISGDGEMVIATSKPSSKLAANLAILYGKEIETMVTSPFDLLWIIQAKLGDTISNRAINHLFDSWPERSAKSGVNNSKRLVIPATIISAIMAIILLSPSVSLPMIIIILNLFFVVTICFKFLLMFVGCSYPKRWRACNIPLLPDKDLPIYTILVPLYKEGKIIPHLLAALRNIEYPKEKLDIKLVVEADDLDTIQTIKELKPEAMFEIIEVPKSEPRTKPKACNYALQFAKGKYLTIYDAEDNPSPKQLRLAASMFAKYKDSNVACLQARLNYYNREENLLTKLFSIEYASLFDFLHPALAKLLVPIPLGGTSNHIKTDILRYIGEWDPYNVTEDADLGIRLSAEGYRILPLDSETREESPISLPVWFAQRSRWIKGYIQTWIVYLRRPKHFFRIQGWFAFFSLQLFLGGASMVFIISPIFWAISFLYLAGWLDGWFIMHKGIFYMCILVLVLGMLIQWGAAILVVYKRGWKNMKLAMLLFPFYWFLHSVASFIALWELIFRPHFWNKTPHGVSKVMDKKLNLKPKVT